MQTSRDGHVAFIRKGNQGSREWWAGRAVGPAQLSNQAVGMQFAHLAAPGQPSRCVDGRPVWIRRLMMAQWTSCFSHPYWHAAGISLLDCPVSALSCWVYAAQVSPPEVAQSRQPSASQCLGFAKTKRANFLIGGLALLLHHGAGICAGISAQPCPKRENPAAGKHAVWWRARRGSEGRSRRHGNQVRSPRMDRYWLIKSGPVEAYQGSTIAEVWGMVAWGARPGPAHWKSWPVRLRPAELHVVRDYHARLSECLLLTFFQAACRRTVTVTEQNLVTTHSSEESIASFRWCLRPALS